MPLIPGSRLGAYEIVSLLGAGGMGEVYKARDTRLNRVVALKRLTAHLERFQQEALAIAALNHPHVCQVYDVGADYLVLEYIEGRPPQGPLPLDRALALAAQIARALEAAHARGILHRDLKPANILVTPSGAAKLLDFGLAKVVSEDLDVTRTAVGAVLGTLAYMAPEQAEGQPVDARADVFSFGAVLYELIAGHRPFEGATPAQVLSAILRDEPRRLETVDVVERLVRRCLEKEPPRRFQTMGEVVQALEEASGAVKGNVAQPSIAVLPFADMSAAKDQEWFSDGLTEEIINALAHVAGLKVTARTSAFAFRGKEQDIRAIAQTLGVDHVLEGSVRRAGERLRVTAQLIKASDGYHLWSERYDRQLADVFALQDEIASSIAAALEVKLGAAHAPRRYTPTVAAYEAYLKARHFQWRMSPSTSLRAKEYYEAALAADPGFAACYVGISHHLMVLAAFSVLAPSEAMPRARDAAQRALELDPALPEAHAILGIVAGIYDFDWDEAERRFRRAMAQNPSSDVRMWYGVFFLVPRGLAAEALEQHRRALEDDPLNITYLGARAEALAATGQWEAAEAVARHMLDLDESGVWQRLLVVMAATGRGDYATAMAFVPEAYGFSGNGDAAPGLNPVRAAIENRPRMADIPTGPVRAADVCAHLCMLRGDSQTAAAYMARAIEQRQAMAARFLGWNCWRSNPHDAELRAMINLRRA
jgi:serine/threonine-protein kinase